MLTGFLSCREVTPGCLGDETIWASGPLPSTRSQLEFLLVSCPQDCLYLGVFCSEVGRLDTSMLTHPAPTMAVDHHLFIIKDMCPSLYTILYINSKTLEPISLYSSKAWVVPTLWFTRTEEEQDVPTDWTMCGTDRPIWVLHA